MSEPTRLCSNCHTQIPESKLDLHEGFCIRNNIKCNRCGNYYDKNDPESHEEEFHQKQQCPHCNQDFQDLSKHNCSKKPIACLHCGLEFQKDQLYQHENVCGSRTQKCSICNKPIMLRDLAKHENTCVLAKEEIPKYQEPAQVKPSRNEIFDKIDKPMQQDKKYYEQKQEQKQQNPYQRQPQIEKKSQDAPPKQDNFSRQDSQTTKTTKYSYPTSEKPSSQKQLSDYRFQQPSRQPVTVASNNQKEQIRDYRQPLQQQKDQVKDYRQPQQQQQYNYGQPSYQQQSSKYGQKQESYNQYNKPQSDKDLYKKQDLNGQQDKFGYGYQRQDSQQDKIKQQQQVSRFQQQQESKPSFDSKYEQKQYQQNKYDKYEKQDKYDKNEPYQRQSSNNRMQPRNDDYRNPPTSQPKPPIFDPYDQRIKNQQNQQAQRQNLVRPDTAIAREIQEQMNLEALGLTEEEMELQKQIMEGFNKKSNQPPQQQYKAREQDKPRINNNQVPEQIFNDSDINNGFNDDQINYAELGYSEEEIRMQQQILESMNNAQQSNKNKNPTKKYYNH